MMASTTNEQESTTINETAEEVGGRKLPHCQPCSKNNRTTVAPLYCHDCKEFQCSECSAHHQTFAVLSGHAIVDWKLKGLEEKTVNMFGFDKCLEHGNPVTIFCEDHEVFCCPTCGFSGHKLCEKAKHIHEFSINVSEFEETLKACKETASQFMNKINEIGKKEESVVKEKVEAFKTELIQKIKSDLKEALKDIKTLADALKSSKEEEISKVSNIQGDIELWKHSLNAASEQGSKDQCFILCKSLLHKTTEYNELLRNQSYDIVPISVHAECNKVVETVVKGEEKLVILLQDKLTTTESYGEYSTDINDTQREQTVHLTSMAFLAFTEEEQHIITSLDFLPDGRLLAVDNCQNQCFVLDEKLLVHGEKFTFHDKDSFPFDVCVYKDNRAVVTTTCHLYFLQINQQNSIRLNKKVETQSYYYSITMFNCSMFLCNTFDSDNGPVRIVDFEGNEIRFIDSVFPDIKYDFEESFSTYITTGIIVLTDTNNSKVHLFNIRSGRIKTVEDDRIQGPTMACVASDNTVFVCCPGNTVIVRISQEGVILQELNFDFEPSTVRISIDEKLVVFGFDGENYKIQLYKLAYQ